MKKDKRWYSLFALAPILIASIWLGKADSNQNRKGQAYTLTTSPFRIARTFSGEILSAKAVDIASTLNQASTITYLVDEGSIVTQGQLIVRFDEGQLQRDVYRLEKEFQLAESELTRVKAADIPLEQHDIDSEISQAARQFEEAKNFLSGSKELFIEGLLSESDLSKHESDLLHAKTQLSALKRKKQIMDTVSHPALIEQTQARVHFAKQELSFVQKQFKACNLYASQTGMVLFKPLHIQNEFRTARTGDSLYRNQVFMQIADMDSLQVQCDIPESEISHVPFAATAQVTPQAFPDMTINAEVMKLGSMAHSLSGRPAWQKFFRCTLSLSDPPDNLRMGMSADIHIISYSRNAALLIPRQFIQWDDKGPYSLIKQGKGLQPQALTLGMSNASHTEIISGLSAGEKVYLP